MKKSFQWIEFSNGNKIRKGSNGLSFRKNIPNIVTSLRFLGTFVILFLEPLTIPYFAVYTATGITDLLDGFLSRRLNAASELGARLDSVADLSFYTVSLIKLLPILREILPGYIWIMVAIMLTVRVLSYIIAAIKFHRFASHHTWLNKITGVFVFAVPYFLVTSFDVPFCFLVCLAGILSTAEDFFIHLTSSKYDPDIKSVLSIG